MEQNALDGGCRQFIMVQLEEDFSESSDGYKMGFKTICDAAKERIRRAGAKIKADSPLTTQNIDTGFRVFRLDESNYEEFLQKRRELISSRLKQYYFSL